jgi:hypothetical protein
MDERVKRELLARKKSYEEDSRNESFNALIYGGLGSGKTAVLRTCRKPLLVHSFDPGGCKTLKDYIDAGDVIADTRFEVEDPKKPSVFKLWDTEYARLKQMKFFDHIGTFALDSLTTFAQAALNAVMHKAGRAGGTPQQNDWFPQMCLIENAIKDFLSLPCDIILTGHDAMTKDEVTGKVMKDVMITGKLVRRLPLLFDEIYYASTKETSKGSSYSLLTQKTSTYQARTRIGRFGKFEQYEEPDIKKLLKKAGYSTDDKPKLEL